MGRRANRDGNNLFRTRDLPLAAWLSLHGFEADRMERERHIALWVYTRTDKLNDLVDQYGDGEVCLNVKDYLDCIANVREDLYAYLDN